MKALSYGHALFLKRSRRKSASVIVCRTGFLLLFGILWELAAKFEWIDGSIFSSPSRIWNTLDSSLLKHMWISTYETVLGFTFGTLIGTLTAIILWWSEFLRRVFEPYLVILNSLPKIALGPIIIVWVGTGPSGIIVMAILISVIITVLNMMNGFYETDPDKILLMRTMKATKIQIFTRLVLPANVPTLLSTLKINVGMAWVGTIMGEYLVSKAGLGYLIVYGSQVFDLDLVMTCTIILCALAGIMYGIVAIAERLVMNHRS